MTWMDTKSGNFVLKLSIPFWNQKNQILSPLLFGTYEFQQRVGFFFAWEAIWGKTWTLDKLKRRDLSLRNKCFMSKSEEKSIHYILLHCDSTRMLWHLVFSMFGIWWVIHSTPL